MLKFKAERFVGKSAQRIGHWFNKPRLVIWGMTHTPFIIEDDELDQA